MSIFKKNNIVSKESAQQTKVVKDFYSCKTYEDYKEYLISKYGEVEADDRWQTLICYEAKVVVLFGDYLTFDDFISYDYHEDDVKEDACASCQVESGNRILRVLKYAYYDMLRDIGLRLLIGLVVAALIQVAVPDEFFLSFGSQPLLQMLVILVIAVPMYICSTGSIPVAAALMMKGLSPGAALVMLMAGPAVNLASILVVHKSMGRRFTSIYLMTIVGFAVLFGLLLNATGIDFTIAAQDACCMGASTLPSPFKIVCATVLTLLIVFALMMKLFSRFTDKKPLDPDVTVYRVEDMHCSHCEAAVVRAVEEVPGVEKAKASASANTLTIKGPATEETIRAAVEGIGYTFRGKV